ncbi:lipocalin family protein [Psychroserpens mesophilus]|uniref:lipocalin family protein n=1 Tax=Psychroserpens mesophilus TaxID=325473 RepID=UPI003D6530FF
MKKRILIYGILITILPFISCSSDDDNSNSNNSTNASLIGTWNGTASTFNSQNAGIPDNNIVKFTSDNRTEFIYEGFGNNGEDISEFGDWSKNGNTLTIIWDDADSDNETYILQISELTENSLKWETEISGEGTLTETFVR